MQLARDLATPLTRPTYNPSRQLTKRPAPAPQRKRRRFPGGFLGFVALWAVAVAAGLALVTQANSVEQLEQRIDELNRQIISQERENQALAATVDGLKNLDRIATIATERLGMVQPEQVAVLATPAEVAAVATPPVAQGPVVAEATAVGASDAGQPARPPSLLDQIMGWAGGLLPEAEAKAP